MKIDDIVSYRPKMEQCCPLCLGSKEADAYKFALEQWAEIQAYVDKLEEENEQLRQKLLEQAGSPPGQ